MKRVNKQSKRLNRTVDLSTIMSKIIAPALKKRGFASRDIIKQWANIAPSPYNRVSIPDRLSWPRRGEGAEGATLHLRCEQAHRLALSYDSEQISSAINRYFGYVLVDRIKISLEAFSYRSDKKEYIKPTINKEAQEKISNSLCDVKDEQLKQSLQNLGEAILTRDK